MNFVKTVLALGSAIGVPELLKSAEGVELNDVLGVVGLERRPGSVAQFLPAIALVAVSAAVGAGIALLVSPSTGSKLRAKLSDRLDGARHHLTDSISRYEATRNHRHAVS